MSSINYDATSTTHCSVSDIVYTYSIEPTPPSAVPITFDSATRIFDIGMVTDTAYVNNVYTLSCVASVTTSSDGTDISEVKEITK